MTDEQMEIRSQIMKNFVEHGVHFQFECGCKNNVPYAYTVGLATNGLPDVLISGSMSPERQFALIHELVGYFLSTDDRSSKTGVIEGLYQDAEENDLPCKVVPVNVNDTETKYLIDHLEWFNELHDVDTNLVQLVWSDEKGFLPHQEEFNPKMKNSFFLLPEKKLS